MGAADDVVSYSSQSSSSGAGVDVGLGAEVDEPPPPRLMMGGPASTLSGAEDVACVEVGVDEGLSRVTVMTITSVTVIITTLGFEFGVGVGVVETGGRVWEAVATRPGEVSTWDLAVVVVAGALETLEVVLTGGADEEAERTWDVVGAGDSAFPLPPELASELGIAGPGNIVE